MAKFLAAIVIALALAMPAGAQSFLERSGINAFFSMSPSTEDFVTQVAANELFKVALGELAERKGDATTRRFAAELLSDHRATSAHLVGLIESGRVRARYPTALDAAQQLRLQELETLNGPDFDREFDTLQADLHEQTISLFERYGGGGGHPDLKQFAYRHLRHLQEHWRTIRTLRQ